MDILMSFSQDYEDIILYHMLKNVSSEIHWIDVGANDPVKISVTKLFSSGGGMELTLNHRYSCWTGSGKTDQGT